MAEIEKLEQLGNDESVSDHYKSKLEKRRAELVLHVQENEAKLERLTQQVWATHGAIALIDELLTVESNLTEND